MPFPEIAPFASGWLPTTDGNEIYWETAGRRSGRPWLHLHGGPGSGIGTRYRRHYDPETSLIIGFDQRGCGRSRPCATESPAALASNTTQALVADMEALRRHLGVEAWSLTGTSWGTTLALAYAEAHPERVAGLVLAAVTTTTAAEVAWITERMRRLFPREWDRFAGAVERRPGDRLIDAYRRRITHPDRAVRATTAEAWCAWEDVHVSLAPDHAPDARFRDPAFRLVFATLVIHYWAHAAFLADRAILAGLDRIGHIPGVLIHGRRDVSSPLDIAWDLHRAWPASSLVIVEDAGHGGPGLSQEVTRAVAGLAGR